MAQRQPRPTKPNLTPLFAFMALGISAILVAALAFRNRKEEEAGGNKRAAETVVDDPFGDMAAKPPLPRGAGREPRARKTHLAPEGVLLDPIWVEASAEARIANALIREAESAKKKGKQTLFEQKAVAGREIFDRILERTADWEEQLFEEYGDTDELIGQIKKERDRWFAKLKKYRSVDDGN